MPGLCLVAHRGVPIDRVAVPPAHALDHHKVRLDEIGDDPLGRALGDAHHLGDVSRPDIRVSRDAEKHLGVVRQEPPGLAIGMICV